MSADAGFSLRAYDTRDEDAAIALWLRSWQKAYPAIDFAERLDWWRARWRTELAPVATIVVAEAGDAMLGFVTVDPQTLYLDQIVVAPEHWGSGVGAALIEEASASRLRGSTSTSISTIRARSASTRSSALPSPAPAKIRSPASRCTACTGGRDHSRRADQRLRRRHVEGLGVDFQVDQFFFGDHDGLGDARHLQELGGEARVGGAAVADR